MSRKAGGILRPPCPFCGTFSGYVAMWLCGYVAVKLCGYAAMWLCAYVAMWLCCESIPWCASITILILWATPSTAGPRSLLILGLQNLGIVANRSWHLWYRHLSFDMLVSLTLSSWGTLGRSWDTWEHNKGHFEVHVRVFFNSYDI